MLDYNMMMMQKYNYMMMSKKIEQIQKISSRLCLSDELCPKYRINAVKM